MSVISVTSRELADMPRAERALLINSLPGYKTGMLVGTCDAQDQTNLAIISSQVHLGSNPPLLAMILRPTSGQSERHTLGNILETRCWTLNGFTLDRAARAHQTSAPYPRPNLNSTPVDLRKSGCQPLPRPLSKTPPYKSAACCASINPSPSTERTW